MFIKWIIILLAVINFGYMTFDGVHALTTGDYIRPTSGTHAGQLGPWSNVVSAVGINPESTPMKVLFIVWGLVGLYITYGFITGKPWGWKAMLIFNLASLWYAMIGTIASVMQCVLLTLSKLVKQGV